MNASSIPLLTNTPDSTGASPAVSPAAAPVESTPFVVQRWISRDGVRNTIAVTHIDLEPCDWCTRSFAVDVLTAVIGEGLLCPPCTERLREDALTA